MKKTCIVYWLLLVAIHTFAQEPSAILGTNTLPVTVTPPAEAGTPDVKSLNGTWRFKMLPTIQASAPEGWLTADFDDRDWNDIQVPGNWETQGFKTPEYGRALTACAGLYRTRFTCPDEWKGRRVVLRTEGVHMSYECWLNGKYVGAYGSPSNPCNFDVTPFLLEGSNTLCFKVTTRSRAWMFDTVDNWTYTGINRDVTLFTLPASYIEDITFVSENCTNAEADIRITVTAGGLAPTEHSFRIALSDEGGQHVMDAECIPDHAGKAEVKAHIRHVNLWTAETPRLYTLQIALCDPNGQEVHRTVRRVGLREVKRQGREIHINGVPVKLHGVCVSEVHPYKGNAYTPEEWRKQLTMMKKAHVNFVRTAHYPMHPAFYDLCDEMGFYVCNEIPLASRGGAYLQDSTYRTEVEARAIATVSRDKNHPCVILWSLGNENSSPTASLATQVKKLDPTRLRGFPQTMGVALRMMRNPHPDVDVIMGHYMREEQLDVMADRATLPFLQTEYAHSLALGFGEFEQKWARIMSTPGFAGGSIWCWMDGAALTRPPKSRLMKGIMPDSLHYLDSYGYKKPKGAEERDKEANDGIVYADGSPQEDYWLVRKLYCPVQIEEDTLHFPLRLTVLNRYDFRPLTGYTLHWQLQNLHNKLDEGRIALHAEAHTKETLSLPATQPGETPHNDLMLHVTVRDAAGEVIHERRLPVTIGRKDYKECLLTAPADERIKVSVTPQGRLLIREKNGPIWVDSPLYLRVGRQPSQISERRVGASMWNPYILTPEIRSYHTRHIPEGKEIRMTCRWHRPKKDKEHIDGEITVRITDNGAATIGYTLKASPEAGGKLTECGLTVEMADGFDTFRWLGQGIFSSVPGKSRHNERGLWSLHRDDHRFTGNRSAVDIALLSGSGHAGIWLHSGNGNIGTENIGGHIFISQNIHVSGYGSKFSAPSHILRAQEIQGLCGQLILLPQETTSTPRTLSTLFTPDGPLPTVVPERPFYREYGW